MKLVTARDLEELQNIRSGRCVSIIMPTKPGGADYDSNRIRFKTLLNRAEKELEKMGLREKEVKNLLKSAYRLEGERPYWKDSTRGLAVYAADDFFRTYRLPFAAEESVVVSNGFNVRPLENLLTRQNRYFLLALGLGDNRLFEATPYSIAEIPAANLPNGISETLRFDVFEKHLQGHSTARDTGSGARMTFHGHDSAKEVRQSVVRRYVKDVAAGISDVLAGEHSPLVVAGLHYLLPDFREACEYPYLSSETVSVDPGHMAIDELHTRSLKAAEKIFESELDKALERYGNATSSGAAITDTAEVVKAAAQGRVDTLLLNPDFAVYGEYDHENARVAVREEREPGDCDLASFAAEQSLVKGGRVYTVENGRMPDGAGLAAILRY